MSLAPGTRLGAYEVLALIGAGGMGEVYRARDSKLNRDVALKILPDAFASDPERLARFQREAQVLASPNHPHIAGIIHRDLKPANIKLRPDGTVKVLDFGLAKALDPASSSPAAVLSNSPTITTPAATRMDIILGTAAYMSPEQAKGKPVDKRSDIWAFGCVLYEILTGTRAFAGEDVPDTLAFIITREPDWTALPANTPGTIRTLLRRCLEKDRKRRLRDIGDARMEIDEGPATDAVTAAAPLANAGVRAAGWSRALPWTVAVAMGAVLVLWAPWRKAAAPAPLRLSAELGADVSLANTLCHFCTIRCHSQRHRDCQRTGRKDHVATSPYAGPNPGSHTHGRSCHSNRV
jgi:hypothetical protein